MRNPNIQAPSSRETPRTNIQRSWVFNVKIAGLALVIFGATKTIFAQTNSSGTNAAPLLLPPYGEIKPTFWELHSTIIIIAGVILFLLLAQLIWFLSRPKRRVPPMPGTVARMELAKWSGQPEDGACLSAVSQILRHYFSTAFRLVPGEMNTAEFCTAAANDTRIGRELAAALATFLHACDERKFSTAPGVAPLDAVRQAQEFLARGEAIWTAQQPKPA
jgi:hypothetical protein